jgi:hypothetical protein
MKSLENVLGSWVERIPNMLTGKDELLSKTIPVEASKFLVLEKIDAIGIKIMKVVHQEFNKAGQRTLNANLEELPISYDKNRGMYVIPKNSITYTNRNKLKDLGFRYDGDAWVTKMLDQRVIKELPQAAKLIKTPERVFTPTPKDASEWFFHQWLPANIERFSKIFTDYGRSEGVPYEFKFVVQDDDVTVRFERNIQNIDDAITELVSRYKSADREGWIQAVDIYKDLRRASGKRAMQTVDRANDLQHNHGAMIEHFPPDVRSWYPAFLDFKYSASVIQMIRSLSDQDLKEIAMALFPSTDPMERFRPSKTDTRTVRGLAMEIAAQSGKVNKKKRLQVTRKLYPDMYDDVLKHLESMGLDLD